MFLIQARETEGKEADENDNKEQEVEEIIVEKIEADRQRLLAAYDPNNIPVYTNMYILPRAHIINKKVY